MQHTVYLFDRFHLDVTRRQLLSSGGLVLRLSSRAMDALLLLLANAGEVVEKRRLMETVWPNTVVEENNLNQCIAAIRKALGEVAGSNRFIMTVPGRGYSFVCPVRTSLQESEAEESARGKRTLPVAVWVGIGFGAALLALLLLRVSMPETVAMVNASMGGPARTTITDNGPPAILLRLRETAAADAAIPEGSTALLAHCLASRPDLRLRVRVELIPGEPDNPALWSGQYSANAQDLMTVQESPASANLSCNKLLELAAREIQPGTLPAP